MQAAADQKPSAMVSVIGLSSEKVCAALHNCEVAEHSSNCLAQSRTDKYGIAN